MKKFYLLCSSLYLGACASPYLYHWGNYEKSIYDSYQGSNSQGPTKHIEMLNEDINHAQKNNLKLPPGFHAHMGMLYHEVGNQEMARSQFELEKKNFPESELLMNYFSKRLSK